MNPPLGAPPKEIRRVLWRLWLSMALMWFLFLLIVIYSILTNWRDTLGGYLFFAGQLGLVAHLSWALMKRPPWLLPK